MKKWLSFCLALVMVFLLASCGETVSPSPDDSGEIAATPSVDDAPESTEAPTDNKSDEIREDIYALLLKGGVCFDELNATQMTDTKNYRVDITLSETHRNDFDEACSKASGIVRDYVISEKIPFSRLSVSIETDNRRDLTLTTEDFQTGTLLNWNLDDSDPGKYKTIELGDLSTPVPSVTSENPSDPTSAPKASPTPTKDPSTSRTVYVTPKGTKYHYISTCGGKNSAPIDISKVGTRKPCSKCVH